MKVVAPSKPFPRSVWNVQLISKKFAKSHLNKFWPSRPVLAQSNLWKNIISWVIVCDVIVLHFSKPEHTYCFFDPLIQNSVVERNLPLKRYTKQYTQKDFKVDFVSVLCSDFERRNVKFNFKIVGCGVPQNLFDIWPIASHYFALIGKNWFRKTDKSRRKKLWVRQNFLLLKLVSLYLLEFRAEIPSGFG